MKRKDFDKMLIDYEQQLDSEYKEGDLEMLENLDLLDSTFDSEPFETTTFGNLELV